MNYKIKVGVIITDNNDRVLLIKEKTEKTLIPLWNIVKGTYGDFRQESIFEAAIREAKEEAGVDIELTGLLGCYVAQKNDESWTQFTFTATIVNGSPFLANSDDQLERNEAISELRWFTRSELKNIRSNEFLSKRIFLIINDWLNNEKYDLQAIKQID